MAFVYQFSSSFSLGLWAGAYTGGLDVYPAVYPEAGLRLVVGNNVDGLALLVDVGYWPAVGLYYYRGIFVAFVWVPNTGLGGRAGYSIFVGRR